MQSPHLVPIHRVTVTDEIVTRLTNMIVDEGLRPGDKLPSERVLMRKLAVGRSSLREAIKILSGVGIVEVSVGEGMFVSGGGTSILSKPLSWRLLIGERSTEEIVEARRVIEVELAALAAERATPDEVAAVESYLAAMNENRKSPEAYSRYDLEFHLATARAAHNAVLLQVLDTLRNIVRAWIDKNIADYEVMPQSLEEHIPIYESLLARDPEAARRSMALHLNRAGARLLAIDSGPSA